MPRMAPDFRCAASAPAPPKVWVMFSTEKPTSASMEIWGTWILACWRRGKLSIARPTVRERAGVGVVFVSRY